MKATALALGLLTAWAALVAAQDQSQPAPKSSAVRPRGATNSPIEITSQSVTHSNIAGVTIFTGNVKAWDDKMELFARKMTVKFVNVVNANKSETRSIASILADGDVVIVNKQDKTRAAADHALYQAAADTIELTGNTLMESSGLFTTADVVFYDRAGGVLTGKGNVKVVVDPGALGRTNLFQSVKPEPKNDPGPAKKRDPK